nr:basic proline-rich protein-like [Mirounga angustirostris]
MEMQLAPHCTRRRQRAVLRPPGHHAGSAAAPPRARSPRRPPCGHPPPCGLCTPGRTPPRSGEPLAPGSEARTPPGRAPAETHRGSGAWGASAPGPPRRSRATAAAPEKSARHATHHDAGRAVLRDRADARRPRRSATARPHGGRGSAQRAAGPGSRAQAQTRAAARGPRPHPLGAPAAGLRRLRRARRGRRRWAGEPRAAGRRRAPHGAFRLPRAPRARVPSQRGPGPACAPARGRGGGEWSAPRRAWAGGPAGPAKRSAESRRSTGGRRGRGPVPGCAGAGGGLRGCVPATCSPRPRRRAPPGFRARLRPSPRRGFAADGPLSPQPAHDMHRYHPHVADEETEARRDEAPSGELRSFINRSFVRKDKQVLVMPFYSVGPDFQRGE